MSTSSHDLALAHELAELADAISLASFGSGDLHVSTKPDRTLVTEADRAVEFALRERLRQARPNDGVLGEELGEEQAAGSARRWILDPIDGTNNYLRANPIFATLIALEEEGELTLGMASAPALSHRWWAVRGEGAFRDGRTIRVSTVDRLEEAQLSYDSLPGFERVGLGERFLELARRCWRTRAFGDFWQHMLVAEGAVDVAVEPHVAFWDLAASKVIVEEAGGRFSDLAGSPRADGGSAISSNGLMHAEVVRLLSGGSVSVPF